MAGNKALYLEKKVLDLVLGATAYTAPGTVYVGLLTDSNSASQRGSGTFTEVSTGNWTNYARIAVTNNTTNWPNATGAAQPANKSNGTAIAWGATTIPSGTVTITAFMIFDAASSGNVLYFGDLSANKVLNNNDTLSFAIGALVCTET